MTGAHRPPLLPLFPEINPYASGYLPTDDGHELYWEQCGNPDGVPILVLHGGPGGGTNAMHRRFFDPDAYRIILFDQRGAGRSLPFASTQNNTRQKLVDDMEALRRRLSIDCWHLFGGSWGSTLALSYAALYPQHISAMILRGIFLLEQNEIDWWLYGVKSIFPEAWEQFAGHIPESEQDDLLAAYRSRLNSDDSKTTIDAAIHWAIYETAIASLIPNYEILTTDAQKNQALGLARIKAHFLTHEVLPPGALIDEIDKFRHIPAIIIQGRYDMVTPLVSAQRLHTAWPEADYVIVPDGGHSSVDPGVRSRLIEATETFKTL